MTKKYEINNEETEVITFFGTINRFLYGNFDGPEDEFKIIEWQVLKGEFSTVILPKKVTVKGVFEIPLEYGQEYKISAEKTEHPKYGFQYKIKYINPFIDLASEGNQKNLLRQFLTELQIEECYKILENPLQVIMEHDSESLTKVKGIGAYIAEKIFDRFEEYRDCADIYLKLENFNLSASTVRKMVSVYKSPDKVIRVLQENPYDLIGKIPNIGFKKVDTIALGMGFPPKGVARIKSLIVFILNSLVDIGYSYISSSELAAKIFEIGRGKDNIFETYTDKEGNIKGNNINSAILELIKEDIIAIEENQDKGKRRVYLRSVYEMEGKIAFHLMRILRGKNNFKYENWEQKLDSLEKQQDWSFTEEQRQGIECCLKNQLSLITGGAGSGKSSLVAGVLSVLNNYTFAQTALSGKASARLQEITHQEGKTIHRLLEYEGLGFKRNQDYPLSEQIIILDEISMVGGEIFLSLLEAIPTGSKLIILGDLNQLEAIGSLNIAYDLSNSPVIPKTILTKIHRQAQKSGIITTAYNVKEQIPILSSRFTGEEIIGELQDMVLDIQGEHLSTADRAFNHFKEEFLGPIVNKDITKIQVLCPIKERGKACVEQFNRVIQKFYNPPSFDKEELIIKNKITEKGTEITEEDIQTYRVGDKVMCLQNDYKTVDVNGEISPIFNGWQGIVKEILPKKSGLLIKFDLLNYPIEIKEKFIKKKGLTLGYASTVHKYQGSSATVVIGILDYSVPPTMRNKELLYTLLTRAEKKCILVGQNAAIVESVKSSNVPLKKTFLLEFLETLENKIGVKI